ncbi:MAG: enoyl-CoA hydratase/isomerase family protein [Rhodoferax sp.]|uniref:enoyl-CoA hydratase/isomerase family protein n=1 Tax=Rhodoferax sp. TaxID=50421 RepID=UPI00260C1B04|nr:enoyl-CoA hydratase/isomerase family protein [Rhodoferax sp.]MDD5335774.1 enoyl-CoA hydratase/isomerase family protein [Rhodoferax sp.]
MSGSVRLAISGPVASVTLSHPGKLNAMSRLMWRQLRSVFESIQQNPDLRCVVIAGANQNFCAGGDISEYVDFRFQEASLREFHETDVWGGLQAMLDCDLPIVAQIEGQCMGAGVEIASCCDIRLAGASTRFGAPIAKLGFPMAPREAQLVAREAGFSVARQMLLEAAILTAADMKAAGFLSRVLADQQVADETLATGLRIAALAPQAARLNKQTLRALTNPATPAHQVAKQTDKSYGYAHSAEHREGIQAFLEKRKPVF